MMATQSRDPDPTPTPISDVPWPRRTNKACCNCRRDKIKCDGERPCAACLRRGLGDDKCIDGCPPCRRSRARCDGADPCARCLQLGIDCSDEPTSPTTNMDDIASKSAVGSLRSAPMARAKLACFACRRDNKKCDDNRPCMRCMTRMEECIHVDRTPKAVKHRCVNCRKENKKCEDNRPCRHCVDMKLECTDAPRKGSGGARVKQACANCRRNKVQCDPERPCRVCVRRGLECFMPSCSCAEQGLQPGTCRFCRSQKFKRDSQTMTDSARSQASDETQTPVSDISPQSAGSSQPGYHGVVDLQGHLPTPGPSFTYEHHAAPQGRSFPPDMHTGVDPFSRAPYMQGYPTELSPPANPFEYHGGLVTIQEPRQDISAYYSQQHAHPDFTTATGENIFTSLDMVDTTDVGDRRGLDNLSGALGIGAPAHPKDPSVPTTFIPQYQHQQPPTDASLNTQSGHSEGAPASFQSNHDVGVGFGTYGADGLTSATASAAGMVYGDPTRSYGPVPMAMPVSVSVPVRQTVHSREDPGHDNVGQVHMHPQLRHSANYLTSESRIVLHRDGS